MGQRLWASGTVEAVGHVWDGMMVIKLMGAGMVGHVTGVAKLTLSPNPRASGVGAADMAEPLARI